MADTRLSQDKCYINEQLQQNKQLYKYHMTDFGAESCSNEIPFDNSVQMYSGQYQSMPVNLIDNDSALRGLGTHHTKCGIACGGGKAPVQNIPPSVPELCPIIQQKLPSKC